MMTEELFRTKKAEREYLNELRARDFLNQYFEFEVEKLWSSQALLKRDFSGRIYHKIVGDWSVRKVLLPFFTINPASYLVSYLTVFQSSNRRDRMQCGDKNE